MAKKTLTATGQTLKRGQALKVDWDQVRLTTQALGYDEAAKLHGISKGAIKMRASRYSWVTSKQSAKKKLVEMAKTMPKEQARRVLRSVTASVTQTQSSDELLASHMDSCRTAVRRGLSTALRKASQAAEDMDGLSALDASRKIKDIADTARTVLGIGEDTGAPTVNVTLLGVGLDALLQRQRERIIDVTPRG
jgi:hypothetical protein